MRALNPHVGTWLELPNGDRLGVRRRDGRWRDGDRRPGALAARDGRLLSARPTGRSSCSRSSRPAAARWRPAAWLRGQGARIVELTPARARSRYRVARGRRDGRRRLGRPRLPRRGRARGPRRRASAPSRSSSPTGPCSGCARSTTCSAAASVAAARPGRPARCATRCGWASFQLLFLDGVPDHAAVEQTVELVKAESPRAHGFANAVMRRVAREGRAARRRDRRRRRPRAPRSRTRTRTGSRGCGGTSSAPTRRAR